MSPRHARLSQPLFVSCADRVHETDESVRVKELKQPRLLSVTNRDGANPRCASESVIFSFHHSCTSRCNYVAPDNSSRIYHSNSTKITPYKANNIRVAGEPTGPTGPIPFAPLAQTGKRSGSDGRTKRSLRERHRFFAKLQTAPPV